MVPAVNALSHEIASHCSIVPVYAISVNEFRVLKALSPIVVTPVPITTEFRVVHP